MRYMGKLSSTNPMQVKNMYLSEGKFIFGLPRSHKTLNNAG